MPSWKAVPAFVSELLTQDTSFLYFISHTPLVGNSIVNTGGSTRVYKFPDREIFTLQIFPTEIA
jgi:hypothetical protein